MQIKGVPPEVIHKLALTIGAKLVNERKQGNFHAFVLRPLAGSKLYRSRNPISGRSINAICFHGHWELYSAIFAAYPAAIIKTCMDRYDAQTFAAKAQAVGQRNVGSRALPFQFNEKCDC